MTRLTLSSIYLFDKNIPICHWRVHQNTKSGREVYHFEPNHIELKKKDTFLFGQLTWNHKYLNKYVDTVYIFLGVIYE